MDEKFPLKENENKTFKQSRKKKVLVTNRNNYPFDLHIGRFCYRLEPRGKENDSIELENKIIKNSDIKSSLNKIIIKEI